MIAYASRTNNNKDIVKRVGIKSMELSSQTIVEEPYFLLTYTDGLGEIPSIVCEFLDYNDLNVSNLKGVIASGNYNFGHSLFCRSADLISEKYNVPVIRKIDLRGNSLDVKAIKDSYNKMIVGELS